MEPNPYAKYLAGRNPIEIIASTHAQLSKLAPACPRTSSPCARHRANGTHARSSPTSPTANSSSASAFARPLADDHPTLQPFDQDRWAARYANYDMDQRPAPVWRRPRMEPIAARWSQRRGTHPPRHPSRTRHHDPMDDRRNHGRPRPEPLAADRTPGLELNLRAIKPRGPLRVEDEASRILAGTPM